MKKNLLYFEQNAWRQYFVRNFQRMLAPVLMLVSFTAFAQNAPSHDPSTMIRNVDGRYWIFTTGRGVWCMSSRNADFTNWRAEPTPFPSSSWPSWINSYVPGFSGDFWAPEVIKIGNYFYLYYSCSTFGSSRSAIGVTRATSLSGPWTDLGVVVSSNGGSNEINAIDPALFRDTNGRIWMSYGSFFGGIGVVEINSSTGKTTGGVTRIAGGNHHSIEAPFIMKDGSYYYLFLNRGSCCQGLNSTYYITVSRATSVTGPYSGESTFIPNRDGRFIGPGHAGYGEGRFTYHFYDGQDNGNAKLRVRTDFGFSGGWPYVGFTSTPPPSSGGAPVSGGTYRITPRHSGKAMDVQNCGSGNGSNVQQWTWLNNNCQKWMFTSAGTDIWRISPANATGQALDVANCSGSNNANIQLWGWLNNDCQKWELIDRGSGYYSIRSRASGRCLDVSGNSTGDGVNIVQYACSSTAQNQQFRFESTTSGRLDVADDLQASDNSLEDLNIALRMFPNPVEDILKIEVSGEFDLNLPVRLSLYSGLGQLIRTEEFRGKEYALDLGNIPSGIYFIKLQNGSIGKVEKIIKQ